MKKYIVTLTYYKRGDSRKQMSYTSSVLNVHAKEEALGIAIKYMFELHRETIAIVGYKIQEV